MRTSAATGNQATLSVTTVVTAGHILSRKNLTARVIGVAPGKRRSITYRSQMRRS